MLLARVLGTVVATIKDPNLHARKLQLIQPIDDVAADRGSPLVAIDGVGVGVGETVIFVRGREASFVFLPEEVPADASIVGKVDAIDISEAVLRPRRSRATRASRRRTK